MTTAQITIRQVSTADDLAAARELLVEYGRTPGWAACFVQYEQELAELPGDCAPPKGRLLLARHRGEAVGVVALRPLGESVVELRRLFVRPSARGLGLGKALVERALAEAREAGHERVVLHTLPTMATAHALYVALGFRPCASYARQPVEGVLFLDRVVG